MLVDAESIEFGRVVAFKKFAHGGLTMRVGELGCTGIAVYLPNGPALVTIKGDDRVHVVHDICHWTPAEGVDVVSLLALGSKGKR